jgi:hypothetical protein
VCIVYTAATTTATTATTAATAAEQANLPKHSAERSVAQNCLLMQQQGLHSAVLSLPSSALAAS